MSRSAHFDMLRRFYFQTDAIQSYLPTDAHYAKKQSRSRSRFENRRLVMIFAIMNSGSYTAIFTKTLRTLEIILYGPAE